MKRQRNDHEFDPDECRRIAYSALGRKTHKSTICDPDDAQEAVSIAWECFCDGMPFKKAVQRGISDVRGYRKARMLASEAYWREQHPNTIRDVVRWAYRDNDLGEVARVIGPFPAVPIETPETRKHRFVVASDYDLFPTSVGNGMDDDDRQALLALETIDRSTAKDVAALFRVWSNDTDTLHVSAASAVSVHPVERPKSTPVEIDATPWGTIVSRLLRELARVS